VSTILVIAPHADDEILGCGATIAKHILNKDEVFVIISTNAHIGAPELCSEKDIMKVRQEASEAHLLLGIKKTFFLDFPAPALNSYPEYKISLSFLEIMQEIKPVILYLPHHGDLHQDHKAIYRAALVAARPQGDFRIFSIRCYETLSETEWTPMQEPPFIPNCYIDVSCTFEKKIKAMTCYKSQLKEFPHSRSLEAIEALAKYRGATIGVKKAEAFIIERQIF
jgi:LmbE family N-acetylglucosaminyl deacetylase